MGIVSHLLFSSLPMLIHFGRRQRVPGCHLGKLQAFGTGRFLRLWSRGAVFRDGHDVIIRDIGPVLPAHPGLKRTGARQAILYKRSRRACGRHPQQGPVSQRHTLYTQDRYITSVTIDGARITQAGGACEKHGPTMISTKKKTISRTRRKIILDERDRAMVCETR